MFETIEPKTGYSEPKQSIVTFLTTSLRVIYSFSIYNMTFYFQESWQYPKRSYLYVTDYLQNLLISFSEIIHNNTHPELKKLVRTYFSEKFMFNQNQVNWPKIKVFKLIQYFCYYSLLEFVLIESLHYQLCAFTYSK